MSNQGYMYFLLVTLVLYGFNFLTFWESVILLNKNNNKRSFQRTISYVILQTILCNISWLF